MSTPRIGLALGGGAARGLAHISMIEAFEMVGVAPSVIAGTSIGALIGAAYASGLDSRTIKAHAIAVLGKRIDAARRVIRASPRGLLDLINFNPLNAPLFDGLHLTRLALQGAVAHRVEETKIPFRVIATDFYARSEVVLDQGPMIEAIAASIAIPGVISGPVIDGRPLIDGGCVNPVPFEHVRQGTDLVVAIDVTGGPIEPSDGRRPNTAALISGSLQIQQRQIALLKRRVSQPDIYIEPSVDHFKVHEFFRIEEILEHAAPSRDLLARELERRLARVA